MKWIKLVFSLFLIFTVSLQAQRVDAFVNKSITTVQEPVQLSISFEDIKGSPNSVDLSSLKDFKIVGGPYSSTSLSITNGKRKSMKKISYDLLPEHSGKLTIPELNFKIGGRDYSTQKISIVVKKTKNDSGEEDTDLPDIFIETVLPHEYFYLGETFTVTYRLYTTLKVSNFNSERITTLEGYIVDEFKENKSPQAYNKTINGKSYLVADILSMTLTGTEVGELILPSLGFIISVKDKSYDPFFGFNTKDYKLYSEKKELDIQALPPGAGASFTGAVGDFFMTLSLDSTRVSENQSVILKAEVSGHGNLDHFTFPKISFPKQLEYFEPDVKTTYSVGGQDFSGKKIWEFIIIPGMPGIYDLNNIEFTYFSTVSESFKTIKADPLTLTVESAGMRNGKRTQTQLGHEDIRYIEVRESRLIHSAYEPFKDIRNWLSFIFACFLILCWFCLCLFIRYREKNMKQILKKNASVRTISELKKIDPSDKPEKILRVLDEAFSNYFKHKYEQDINDLRQEYPTIDDVCRTIETYKYAPGILNYQLLNSLKLQILDIIETFEEEQG